MCFHPDVLMVDVQGAVSALGVDRCRKPSFGPQRDTPDFHYPATSC